MCTIVPGSPLVTLNVFCLLDHETWDYRELIFVLELLDWKQSESGE